MDRKFLPGEHYRNPALKNDIFVVAVDKVTKTESKLVIFWVTKERDFVDASVITVEAKDYDKWEPLDE